MIVLQTQEVRKHFGDVEVLSGVTFEVRPGEKIGLVGPNGTGKTTLLRILAGEEEADGGTCHRHDSVRIGYMQQHPIVGKKTAVWDEARTTLQPLLTLQRDAEETARALAECDDPEERRRLADRYDYLQQELHRQDAYNLDHKVERVLDGLGFPRSSFQSLVGTLSGGEQNRLMLAKLLLAEPDLMLLDEPSNHLDIDGTEWLEEFLASSTASMILVSHDRYFLDKVTNHTLELFHGTVERYTGNFSTYWRQKSERLLVQRRTYEKQQTEIEKMKEFIRRNSYGQKHAQAEDRRKKLERIETVAPPREIAAPVMGFSHVERSGDVVFRVERLTKSFDRMLFSNLTFDIQRGERWAILGPNGSGKSTLLRCLLGEIEGDEGQVATGQGVEVGYFDQHLRQLAGNETVVDAIRPQRRELDQAKRRDLLARFGLTGDTHLQKVGSLSGGEQCRAALARLAAEQANVLILDEPTNHLDLWACDSLEQSLRAFQGTVIFVSHDRYFVDQIADHLLVVEADRFRAIAGNYSTYQHFVAQGLAGPTGPEVDGVKPAKKTDLRQIRPDEGKPRRKRRFPYRKVSEIEAEIFQREASLERLHEELADPSTHRDADCVRRVKSEIKENQAKLAVLYEHWEEAAELNW